MGEVIEHVYNPVKFIKSAKNIINPNGRIFISTCANCAQEDHLYRFKNIKEECKRKRGNVRGVLVDKIEVDNENENGIVKWDILKREGLEIEEGMYREKREEKVKGD